MLKYEPQRIWRTAKLMESDIEFLEEKSQTRELTDDEQKRLNETKVELVNYNKWRDENTFCSKCDCVIDNGKQAHPDLCCECEK